MTTNRNPYKTMRTKNTEEIYTVWNFVVQIGSSVFSELCAECNNTGN